MALRKDGLRGQAFVIFEDVSSATEALQNNNSLVLFGKPLKIEYANQKSDRISKQDGSYVPKAKREKKKQKDVKKEEETAAIPSEPAASAPAQAAQDQQPPSHILFAVDLPTECNEMMLAMLFRQYLGFKEVRIPRDGLAFIEFDSEPHATLALNRLNGFQLTTKDTLQLTYGKA